VLAVLLIPLLACPPTSIPTRDYKGGHFLASPYGVPYELEPTSVAPRSLPMPDVWLPLWDLDASLAEVEAQLALDNPPDWAPWIAWVLPKPSDYVYGHAHLLDALASSELAAEHLAWWRASTDDPTFGLRAALDRSKGHRTRALLTTTLALTEYARSCPVPVDVDGACRSPGTDLLLRRGSIPLERARHWTKLARTHWAKLELANEDLATRALWAEFQLALATADYESLLDAELPADLSFVVEDWRKDSGVPAWEAEYERQLALAEESKARVGAWFESTMDCARTQLDLHEALLWIDARSSGVVLLRSARMLLAFAEALGPDGQGEPVYEQAHQYLTMCLEHSQATLDGELEQACTAMLAPMDDEIRPLIEFTGQPRTTTTMVRDGVLGSPD
jgi:hypothetical protein